MTITLKVIFSNKIIKLFNSINWSLANELKLEEFLKKLKDSKA